jgi:hypothetical protein
MRDTKVLPGDILVLGGSDTMLGFVISTRSPSQFSNQVDMQVLWETGHVSYYGGEPSLWKKNALVLNKPKIFKEFNRYAAYVRSVQHTSDK